MKTNKNSSSPFGDSVHNQSVDFVELFFDLVFVFAITRTTHLVAHHLDFHTISQALLMFALVWWAWTQFTWTLNSVDTSRKATRVVTLIITGIAFIMATSVDMAFKEGVLWFVVPYLIIRLVGLVLISMGSSENKLDKSIIIPVIITALLSLLTIFIGAFVKPDLRQWLWFLAIIMDLLSGVIAGRGKMKLQLTR